LESQNEKVNSLKAKAEKLSQEKESLKY
jgi:hypothetical protein